MMDYKKYATNFPEHIKAHFQTLSEADQKNFLLSMGVNLKNIDVEEKIREILPEWLHSKKKDAADNSLGLGGKKL